jgi:hypothetical protein
MRVVLRAEHTVATSGCVAHAVEGPAALVERATDTAAGRGWAEAMADIAVECPRRRTQRSAARIETAIAESRPPAERLYSWVIARVEHT